MRQTRHPFVLTLFIVAGILLGHDAVMAMNPHGDTEGTHHSIAVQECGPDHQSAALSPLLPTVTAAISTQPPAATVAFVITPSVDQDVPLVDASTRRASLQVYLM